MEDNKQLFECQECGAEGSATTDMDLVIEFCPFCGEPLDDIEWNDYENEFSESEGQKITTEVYAASNREA